MELVLATRRLDLEEVLRLGLCVCDHWRRHGVALSDIRPHQLLLGLGGDVRFGPRTDQTTEPEINGVRALGGLLARALDRTAPGADRSSDYLSGLAGAAPNVGLAQVRAEVERRLAALGRPDDLVDGDAPTVGLELTMPSSLDHTSPTELAVSSGPAVARSASRRFSLGPATSDSDPYADTYIRPRSELVPDQGQEGGTEDTGFAWHDESMKAVAAGVPGPAAEPVPTGVQAAVRPGSRRPRLPAVLVTLVVLLCAAGAGAAFVLTR